MSSCRQNCLIIFSAVILGLAAIAATPPKEARAEPATMLVIGGVLAIGSAIARSHKSGINPIIEKIGINEQLLHAQQSYLDQILINTTELGAHLVDIQQQIYNAGEQIGKKIAHSASKQATDRYLAAIDTLKEDAHLKITTGVNPTVEGATRINAVDQARNELLKAGPLYSLPALLSGWQIEIAYRKALGHETALVKGVDANYRKHISGILKELTALHTLSLSEAQRLHEIVISTIVAYQKHKKALWPYYGRPLYEWQSRKTGIVCPCRAGANCNDNGSEGRNRFQWIYHHETHDISTNMHHGILPMIMHYCYAQPSTSGTSRKVTFARVRAEVITLPERDARLTNWVRGSSGDIANAIKFEEATSMTMMLASYITAARLALITSDTLNYEHHIDTMGEIDWTLRNLLMDDAIDVLINKPPKELLELGLDRVILESDQYPLAFQFFERAGMLKANAFGNWQTILQERVGNSHNDMSLLPGICLNFSAADCLNNIIRQAEWWVSMGLRATRLDHSWRCRTLRIGGDFLYDQRGGSLQEDSVVCIDWITDFLKYVLPKEDNKVLRERGRDRQEPRDVFGER